MSGVFDGQEILERVGGDRELLAELVVLLKEECGHLLPALDDAVEKRDSSALEQAAHKLKGSVGQMAAGLAYATAREIEQSGRAGDVEAARAHVGRLHGEVQVLLEALEVFAIEEESG